MMSSSPRPPFEAYYIYVLLAVAAFFVADVVTTGVRGYMLPTHSPSTKNKRMATLPVKSKSEYASITQRNLFNSDGIIPPPLSQGDEEEIDDSVPVPTQLPLSLIGTIVHGNPNRSVATIQNRSRSQNEQFQAYRVDDEIPGMAQILSISRKQVILGIQTMAAKNSLKSKTTHN